MPTPVHVFDTPEQLGRSVASRIAEGIAAAREQGRRYVLGCPGGRTARSTYEALAAEVRDRSMALDHVVIAMMDEYLEPAQGGAPSSRVSPEAHFSCARFGRTEILDPLNAAATLPIPHDQLWLPDPAHPAFYDDLLAGAGGVDLFLLASGASDGHVAFNPPGSALESRTRVVRLAETTRRDNLHTFPEFRGLDEVPTHGVTVGPGTIAELSRELVLILVGEQKRTAFARIGAVTGYDPDWPATVVHLGQLASISVDRAATVAR